MLVCRGPKKRKWSEDESLDELFVCSNLED